jgi:2-keto-3-deoxy-galactonokinase
MDRDLASRYVHYFHPRLNLLCGYVGARVGWATRAEQVDCPGCLARLEALSASGPSRAIPPRATPLPMNPAEHAPHGH